MITTPIRIPNDVHEQVTRLGALCGEQPGMLLAQAWKEYVVSHRDEFADDLQQAAELVRSASLDELVAFAQDSHHVVVDEDEVRTALESPKLQRFLADAVVKGEQLEHEGRRF